MPNAVGIDDFQVLQFAAPKSGQSQPFINAMTEGVMLYAGGDEEDFRMSLQELPPWRALGAGGVKLFVAGNELGGIRTEGRHRMGGMKAAKHPGALAEKLRQYPAGCRRSAHVKGMSWRDNAVGKRREYKQSPFT